MVTEMPLLLECTSNYNGIHQNTVQALCQLNCDRLLMSQSEEKKLKCHFYSSSSFCRFFWHL